jgi:hypothetical protein
VLTKRLAVKKAHAVLWLLFLPAVVAAEGLSQDRVDELKTIQQDLQTVDRSVKNGTMSKDDAERFTKSQLQRAAQIAEQPVNSRDELDQLVKKYDRSRLWGFFTFINIVLVFAGFLLAIALVWLGVKYCGPLLVRMPATFIEVGVYALVGLGLLSGYLLPMLGIWFVVPACLVLVAALSLTRALHFRPPRRHPEIEGVAPGRGAIEFDFSQFMALTCTLVWGAAAIVYESYLLGFMTMVALEAFLGFSAFVMPGVVGVGFAKSDAVPRATVASFAILVVYVGGVVLDVPSGPLVYFRYGALFMGAFVYFLGLLILASRYYNARRGNYALMQVVTIVSGIAAFYLGATFEIGTLLGIGGTFFVLYLLEKYTELPWNHIGWAWSLLGFALLLYGAAYLAGKYPEYFLMGWR